MNIHKNQAQGEQVDTQQPRPASRWRSSVLAFLAVIAITLPSLAQSNLHNVAAGNVNVVHNDANNNTTSVTVSMEYSVNDLRVRSGSTRGDFFVQVGSSAADDIANGLLISSVSQNGRDNFASTVKTNCVSDIATNTGGYYIPVFAVQVPIAGSNTEYNINVAGAYFPYSTWIGGIAKIASGVNGGAAVTNDTLIGSPQLQYGINYIDKSSGGGVNAGKAVVDLTSLQIDSRTDGVLLVNGAKDEDANYALSQVNTNNGTWNIFDRDAGGGGNGETDPMAFLFVPKTNTAVISGRFLGDGSIGMFSGTAPRFTVAKIATGRYELKIPGRSATNGVLIISGEGGGAINFDNIVSYERNAVGDGWIIESRDTPPTSVSVPPPLESPGAAEGVASFVYIPVSGITTTGTNNLVTTEGGGTATFTVVLDAPPTSAVTINLSSSNTGEGTVSPDFVTFDANDWYIPKTVTVTGQNDDVADGPIIYTINLSPAISADVNYNGLTSPAIPVLNSDNEVGIAVVPSTGLVTTEAGGPATFTVRLNTQPGNDVTIGLSSGNTNEATVSPTSLTFTTSNWDQERTVTVTGVNDLVDDGDIAYTIITGLSTSLDPSYNNLNVADVSGVNVDNDTRGVVVSASAQGVALVEGSATNYTVVLTSQPTGDVTVNVTSSDTVRGGTVSPAALTFTQFDWNSPKTVTVTAINNTVDAGDTAYTITNKISSPDAVYAAIAPITVAALTVDNEAALRLPSGDASYGIGQNGIKIDERASIVDTNFPAYISLTIALTNNGSSDDRLEISNAGTGAGQIGVSGNSVTYGGVALGTFSGGTGLTPLAINFNNSVTPAAAEALLRSVTFRNVNASPSINYRSVSVTLLDADGGVSSAGTRVRVSQVRAIEFQEGADHGYGVYTGENDIHLRQNSPTTAFPSGGGTQLFADYNTGGAAYHVLLRFDNIFGNGAGQIPTNAVIVSADLVLHYTDSGGGSPLYRMLRTWDATSETWASMTNGVDGNDCRTNYDSQIAAGPGGSTGLGTAGVSVLPDVRDWLTNANYGWAMTGWTNKTDGTGFSSSEATTVDDRPSLRVTWLPAGTVMTSFRYGSNGYTNAADAFIRTSTPDLGYFTNVSMFSDWTASTNGDNDQLLFRFDNIIGNGINQIPAGATIQAAMFDVGSLASQANGDGGQIFALLQPWDATTTTWNTWNNGIQNNGVEAAVTPTALGGNSSLEPNIQGGYHSFDLTYDVQAWVGGTRTNFGWAVLPWPNGGDGWGINSAESVDERDRPQLRVFYTPNANVNIRIGSISRTPSAVTIQFSGAPNTTYSVGRTTALEGSWPPPIGTATSAGDGTANFTDNAPPATAAFYRISP
ncbi:MAG: hypothetical protein JWM68_771 [Verrucomicrobiales bacterium]|nr:hypothetical protein [Verrucomicrobiales bacterium]